jgi:hypothetical protein
MAKAADNSSTTWIPLWVARDLATSVILSPRYAEPQIVKWLHLKRIRWRYVNVYGLAEEGRSLEQEAEELWATRPSKVLVEWKESFACKPTRFHYRPGRDIRPLGYITVIGIEIVRENLERELKALKRDDVAEPLLPAAPEPSDPSHEPPAPASESLTPASEPSAPPPLPSGPKYKPGPGAERIYDYDAFIAAAETVLKRGCPDRKSVFFDKVRNELKAMKKKAPPENDNRTLGRIVGSLYDAAKN